MVRSEHKICLERFVVLHLNGTAKWILSVYILFFRVVVTCSGRRKSPWAAATKRTRKPNRYKIFPKYNPDHKNTQRYRQLESRWPVRASERQLEVVRIRFKWPGLNTISEKTRMHSSMMRTVRYSGRLLGCGGVCQREGYVCLADPPVNRMTDACENITFPQLLLRTVKIDELVG